MLALAWSMLAVVPARAGTTGSLSGVVVDGQGGAPIADAKIAVSSPSASAQTTTDARGRFAFVSLAPDEYTIVVEKDGYQTVSIAGNAVFADAAQVVTIQLNKQLKTIASVTSRSVGSLVRSGTTADLYSVNAAQQERTSVLGGGGDLNSAYSAIAAVPGAYVPTNQNGYLQAVHVRGGDSDEVGYEFDGVPVNRAFDNYPSGSFSSLGQLELQVYTGASPADAEGQGLAGFINQVIKTGTYPGTFSADGTLGGPAFYHSLNVEAGGASPDRTFSYYVGIGGFNQDHRYIDQWNGSSYASEFGPPLGPCPTGVASMPASCYTNGSPNVSAAEAPGYVLAPMPFGLDAAGVMDRSSVVNFHFAIPRKNGLRDDVQILYDNDSIQTPLYVSPNDEGQANIAALNESTGYGTPEYSDTFVYNGALGQAFGDGNVASISPYFFPSSPTDREMYADIPANQNDVSFNNQVIVKLQYQHNFSTDAFLRVYGYTYYSNWFASGPASSWQSYVGYDSGDYEIGSHTRGLSASFDDQISPEHLLSVEASYVTSTSERMNSQTVFNEIPYGGDTDNFAVLVNPANLTSGTCYSIAGSAGGAATPTSCGTGSSIPVATSATFASIAASYYAAAPTSASGQDLSNATLANYSCGGGPCQLYTVENGFSGAYNTVTPVFTGFALTDLWRPNDRLVVNAGLRLDTYQYQGANTLSGPARTFWFDAFNNDTCYDTATLTLVDKSELETGGFDASTPCSTFGSDYQAATLNNTVQTFTYDELQPRIGATLTLDPQTVIRASAGKYIEEPSAAYEQYNSLEQNLPNLLQQFYSLGWNTPGHEVSPPVSYNYDFSYEHQFKGTDMSIKITPFLRQTHNQIENFYLNIKQGFISGLNAGNQTSDGFEFAFTKGDFDRDGFAAQLGFAYTYASLKFSTLPNGTTILSPINADIATYNAYTSACAPGGNDYGKSQFGQPLCGTTPTGVAASPCYLAGAASSCTTAGAVANPYWNAPAQGLLNPNASYLPYTVIPGGVGTGVEAYNYPYVATLILQYKRKRLAITPSLQFVAGNRYGAPETTPGVDPSSCSALGSSPDAGRYPYGAAGGSAYDATTCTGTITIPDQYTGQFDGIGAFRQPAQLLGHLRISYDINAHLTATVTLANLLSTCFGGQHTGFTYLWNNQVCSYGAVLGGYVPPVGNDYNPGDNVQTVLRYPYMPVFGTYNDLSSSTLSPFSVYVDLKFRM
ncbi:MAG TPA: TonB-dependent receptor [Candidatus Acidoferrales bacterium]|nr:TonB-dependent receptor [Candidatus Acidoferrales bacterium]